MATALFVCLHNAGRSQMSAALFERAAGGRHRALSAGSEADPAGSVHPQVVEAMRELGIDLADRRPQRLTPELAEAADVVVTMGCGDACPYIPGRRYVDWDLPDPKGRPLDEVRALRDDIARRVAALVGELDAPGERIVHANGVDLCVETFGDAADPAILLLHGVGNSMLSWDEELCERLAAGRRLVVRCDSRDAGRSVTYAPGAPSYTQPDLVADVAGLIDALNAAPAHLVGLSGGAAVAQLMALDHADHVASITLVASTPGIPGEEMGDLPGVAEKLKAVFADEPPEPDWEDRAAVVEYLVEAERPFAARFDEAAMRALAGRVVDRSADIRASVTNPYLVASGDPWRARLREIAVPTLVVHGTEDPLFPYAHGVALADAIPGAELLALEPMGHEYFPPATWDVVVPAILRHTQGEAASL